VAHEWARFWCKPDEAISLVDQGFLLAPDPERGLAPTNLNLRPFQDIAERRCLILVGEPGIGKTSAIEREAQAVEERCVDSEDDRMLRVDLGSTREEAVLREEIFGSEEFTAWADGSGELHLFLDSLDEAALRVGVVGDVILKGLEGVDTSRLRLRLACRTSDRMPQFEGKLAALWPEGEAEVFELAPLTRADVELAATDHGIEAKPFVRELIERDIVGLAIKPITLNMLLELSEKEEGLPESQLELYERGLMLLASEPSERRTRDRDTRGALSPWQRMAVAGRIAAATILSGRGAISTDAAAIAGPDLVSLAELAGRERDIGEGAYFDVTELVLREALDTGLFSARGDHLGWAHQTYGEFLAARYLAKTNASAAQVVSLLVGDGGDGRIVPQLRDVAGWFAALDEEFFGRLAESDPLVLLRGEVAGAGRDHQDRLATALLEKGVAAELEPFDNRNRRNLAALGGENLEELIDERLRNQSQPEVVRTLCCELIGLCKLVGLEGALLEIALAAEEPVALRSAAVRTFAEIASEETRRALIPLAKDPLLEDEDDQIKGWALRAVCPAVVSGGEVLSYLTPQKNRNLTGSYSMFVGYELPDKLGVEELPEALEWAKRTPSHRDPLSVLGGLAERILVRGVEEMERPGVLAALAPAVATWLEDNRELQSYLTRESSDAFSRTDNRRRLVEALIPLIREGELEAIDVVGSTPRLIDSSDLPWLVRRLSDVVGEPEELVWAELVSWMGGRNKGDDELVMEARALSPVLHDNTVSRYGPIELDSVLADTLRRRHRRNLEFAERRRRMTDEVPDYDANIAIHLEGLRAGDLSAFWELNIEIWGEPGNGMINPGGSDITEAPGWKRADPKTRAQIAEACLPYLEGFPPSEDWLDPGKSFYPALAGYRALCYLQNHDPRALDGLSDETLSGWIPAVLSFVGGGESGEEEPREALLAQIAERCSGPLTQCAKVAVRLEATHGEGHLFVLYRLRSALKGPLGGELLALWCEEEMRARPASELLKALLDAGVPGALEAGLQKVNTELIEADSDYASAVGAMLLRSGGGEAWGLWPLLCEHAEWGQSVFESIAMSFEGDFRGDLDEPKLAELFIWLSERFPISEDPSFRGFRTLGPRDRIAGYRDKILTILVERGTDAALVALEQIEEVTGQEFPYARIRAEENRRLKSWVPPRPRDVLELVENSSRRIVLSAQDLQRVLTEALGRLGEMLGTEGQAHQLWNTDSNRPKPETELAAWIANRLREDLRGRGIIINREVEIRVNPNGGIGERTDIHVDAIAGEQVEGSEQVTVVIEVKGSWHRDLMSAMRDQLVDRYLSPSRSEGIYLPVWFDGVNWDETDSRRARSGRRDRATVIDELNEQAAKLAEEGYQVVPYILDANLY